MRSFQETDIAAYVSRHQLDKLIISEETSVAKLAGGGVFDAVNPENMEPFAADWADLVRLHQLVLERKVTTILEFGCGKSTAILAHALNINRSLHAEYVYQHLRRGNPFEVHSVDASEHFIESTKKIIPEDLKRCVSFTHSDVVMSEFGSRICTLYCDLPNVCPDFIYLDAPDQFCARGNVRNISTVHPDRLPMSADLLTIEHFLLPGTFILVDGRTANARFLKCNFQRSWEYFYFPKEDIHTFELIEPPLGKYNRAQIAHCLGDRWLERVDS